MLTGLASTFRAIQGPPATPAAPAAASFRKARRVAFDCTGCAIYFPLICDVDGPYRGIAYSPGEADAYRWVVRRIARTRRTPHAPDDDRRQPSQARVACRAENSVGPVAAGRRDAPRGPARRRAGRPEGAGGRGDRHRDGRRAVAPALRP